MKKRSKKIIFITITFIILLLFFAGFTLGKNYSETQINGITKISEPIFEVESIKPINISNKSKEGIYEFKIKNYESKDGINKITDVEMEYYIEILTNINPAIKLEVYKNDQLINISENKTEKFYMSNKNEEEDNYKFKIIYDKNSNNSIEEIIQDLQIKVHSQQQKT